MKAKFHFLYIAMAMTIGAPALVSCGDDDEPEAPANETVVNPGDQQPADEVTADGTLKIGDVNAVVKYGECIQSVPDEAGQCQYEITLTNFGEEEFATYYHPSKEHPMHWIKLSFYAPAGDGVIPEGTYSNDVSINGLLNATRDNTLPLYSFSKATDCGAVTIKRSEDVYTIIVNPLVVNYGLRDSGKEDSTARTTFAFKGKIGLAQR